MIGGEEVEASVAAQEGALVITAGDVAMKLRLVDANGQLVGLDENGNLRLLGGLQLEVALSGLSAGTIVNVHVFSEPVLLGTVTVGSGESSTGTFTVPEGLESGNHRIVANGVTATGEPVTLVAGVKAGEDTGSSPIRIVIFVVLGLAVLAAVAVPARRRSARAN